MTTLRPSVVPPPRPPAAGESAAGLAVRPAWDGTARVTVAHDYLTQRGGAERVTLALLRAFPGAPLVTSVYAPGRTFAEFAGVPVRTSWLQTVPVVRRDPRVALPLLPRAWNGLIVDDCDVVVASSTGFAHAVRTRARKVIYCHNPPRWLYQRHDYLLGQPRGVRFGLSALDRYLRAADQRAAASADRYIANSTAVAGRIKAVYGVDAPVVHPPVMTDPDQPREPVAGLEPGFYLTVSRRRGYKNTAVACAAVEQIPGARLAVVGGLPPAGPDRAWSPAITGLPAVSDAQLRWLYANCRAVIAPSFEDFGLTPVEGAAFGKPTVALRAGGYLDTVVEGVTGVFADEADVDGFSAAIEALQRRRFDPATLRTHAGLFSLPRFVAQMRHQVADVLAGG